MKRILQGLVALTICGALNFGLTNNAQAAEPGSSIGTSGTENLEFTKSRHGDWRDPPPPHRRRLPPPPPDYWEGAPPPPPPRHGGWGAPPPPPPPRHHDRW